MSTTSAHNRPPTWRLAWVLLVLLLAGLAAIGGCSSEPAQEPSAAAPAEVPAEDTPAPTRGEGSFAATGAMGNDRQYHTMVTLPDGRVLTAGGRGKGVGGHRALVHTSAEIYDPSTGEWAYTGDLAEGRRKHLLAVLPGGSVLAAGGTDLSGFEAIRTAEIWDPVSGTWSATGSIDVAREKAAWAALSDGRVLLTGGVDTKRLKRLSSVEIYDPGTGEWGPAAPMSVERTLHTATTLLDGRVLVSGGGKA